MAVNKDLLHECISCLQHKSVTAFFKSNLLINCPREYSDEIIQEFVQLRNASIKIFIVQGKGHRTLLRNNLTF